MSWWDEIARQEAEVREQRKSRASELLEAIALGDYIDSLPKIHVTDEIAHLVPIAIAGWHWQDMQDMRLYWAAEMPIAQAVAKRLGVTLIMPSA